MDNLFAASLHTANQHLFYWLTLAKIAICSLGGTILAQKSTYGKLVYIVVILISQICIFMQRKSWHSYKNTYLNSLLASGRL